jgi:hypothetical protein
MNSEVLGKKFTMSFHLPETFSYASKKASYPITIIFDSKHKSTYPHIINSMDLLTSESQIPESIVVGIPFDMFNRFYYTSGKIKEGEKLMGIEKTEKFVFEELIPLLQKDYQANNFIQIIGHSRTGFLVNYLVTKRSKEVDIAIALSGFYGNKPLPTETFKQYIAEDSNFPHPFKYYFTAGNSLEEFPYLKDCTDMNDFISAGNKTKNMIAKFSVNSSANHMTNLWVSVPAILMDAFKDYNKVLNSWFQDEEKKKQITNPLEELKGDLKTASNQIGFEVNPGLTQLFSIASVYSSEDKELEKAMDIIGYGLSYYPNYLDLNWTLLEYAKRLGNQDLLQEYKRTFIQRVKTRTDLSKEEKAKIFKEIDSI